MQYIVEIDTHGHTDPPRAEDVRDALLDGLAAQDYLPLPDVTVNEATCNAK